MVDPAHIRNFSIISHIDHGKSTLADRLIQITGSLSEREMQAQVLDNMELERERGITIKAQTVRLVWERHGISYVLNLIDTPGHVDFAYEVSRSLAACEGSLLVVDASQGVEAQTLANVYKAVDMGHEIIVVLNKIDLPAADPARVIGQIEDLIGLDAHNGLLISAKSGQGVRAVLDTLIDKLPAPHAGTADAPLKALLVDSWYDPYLGVVIMTRIFEGSMQKKMQIRFVQTKKSHTIDAIGVFTPKKTPCATLGPGEIGYFTAALKDVSDTRIGDTITEEKRQTIDALPGFKPSQPVVFCGLFPVDSDDFQRLRSGVEKLRLNDASFLYEMETSAALGFGFRCGFLGLLHLEITRERLEREFQLDLISTAPSVVYDVYLSDGTCLQLHNPADLPDPQRIERIEEPWIHASIFTPDSYIGALMKLCSERRGIQKDLDYTGARCVLHVELPLNEVVLDFHDRLKSLTQGYASLDYHRIGMRESALVRMQIRINDEPVDALATIVHKDKAYLRGSAMCEKLKELIPRHMFKIPVQAAIGGKIIARETIPAFRKDVTAKCYGGDVTRKRKLLEKQKAGKRKMRSFGRVDIPKKAFIDALRMDK